MKVSLLTVEKGLMQYCGVNYYYHACGFVPLCLRIVSVYVDTIFRYIIRNEKECR
jgi:hypothetical protein